MRSQPLFATLALLLLLCAPAFAASAQKPSGETPIASLEELPVIPEVLRQALLHGRHEEAERLLDGFLREEPELAGLWIYLGGLNQERAGDWQEALVRFRRVETEYADGSWAAKARFHRAEAHRRLGQWAEAERIWEEAASALRAPERQSELAAVYLRIADSLSVEPVGAKPDAGLDPARAANLYAQVLELEAPAADREVARFRFAQCMELLGNWVAAVQGWERYLGEFGEGGARAFEARYRLGNALLLSDRAADARRVFEDLVDALAAADEGVRAAHPELAGDAAFAVAQTYGSGEARAAIDALGRFLAAHPAHRHAPAAAFETGQRAFASGWDEEAIAAFDAFLARAPRVTEVEAEREKEAALRQTALFRKGEALWRQDRLEAAVAAFNDYTRRHPNGPDWGAAQQGIVDASYQIGVVQRRDEEYDAARATWEAFLVAYPLDPRARQILLDLGELHVEEVTDLPEDDPRRPAGYRAAIEQWRRLSEKYPGSDEASTALFRVGEVLEKELLDLEAAIQAYRACDFGWWAGTARERLVVMTRPHLSIETPRTWRSDEPATLRADLRNIDSLLVQVYPLDLEAYFRKHLTHRRVEDLDLDLIAPEHEFEYLVEDAQDYLPLERSIDLGVEGPGVWAVAVSAGNLRATTLVVRSDIDVVLKSSRREVFVYAQDMRLDEPAAGVDVLLALPGASGGPPEFHELETDADGVARLALDRLREVDWLRLFAVRDGHCAAEGLGLSGLGLAQGLSARGVAYTDRPAYRPGDEVSWRAVLRHVEAGSYAVKEGSRVEWSVLDARGRTIRRGEAPLSAFGTVAGGFRLPERAPVGDYQLVLRAAEELAVAGRFTVAEYQLPRVQLSLEAERDVVFRGEEVVLSVRAAWAYGEPVAGARLQLALPDGRRELLVTDAEGAAEFRYPTRELAQETSLSFHAALPEEGAEARTAVWLATRGFHALVQVRRDVVLAGESFPVSIATTSPGGEPVARKMSLDVVRRTHERGRVVETRVSRQDFDTSVELGRAELAVSVAAGGDYLLRVFGTDRFGNTVYAERTLFVSGAEDDVRLRLLVDDAELEVGETLRANLHNRAGAGLALLTFEGEEILGYRIVRLGGGENALALEVGHEHFPNFTVSAAMMRGNEFFTARADFEVRRELRVRVEPEKQVYAPGEQAWADVVVTDQLGRPVEAEVSVGVVDATLYDLYRDRTPALRGWFETGTHRDAALRTSTTCTFRYDGVTREISQAVLDEAERLAELVESETLLRDALEELDKSAARGLAFRGPGDSVPPGPPAAAPMTAAPSAPGAETRGRLRQLGYVADEEFESGAWNDSVGFGGGAGGQRGGRGGRAGKAGPPEGSPAVTAYWSAAVRTDADGRARISFAVPELSTKWRITARGVGHGTLLGEQREVFTSRTEFFVELRAPRALVEGDRPRLVARLHNLSGLAGEASVLLRAYEGEDATTMALESIEIGAGGVAEMTLPALEPVQAGGPLVLVLEAEADYGDSRLRDAVTLRLPVRPWGVEVADAASGLLTDRATLELELPQGAGRHPSLELFVGHGIDRLLVTEALGQSFPYRKIGWGGPATLADLSSELFGVATLLQQLVAAGGRDLAEARELRARGEALAAAVIAAQRPDGAWAWASLDAEPSAESTAAAMLALARAKRAGLSVPPPTVDAGLARLDADFRAAREQALELKAMLVHAQAAHGRDDFAAANRLHRSRASLSPAGLAHTALALVEMDRRPMAAELAAPLAALLEAGRGGCPVEDNLAWNRSPLEMTALALLALQAATPEHPAAAAAAEHLLARRPWFPPRARGWAVAALAEHQGEVVPATGRLEVAVRVGGGAEQVLALGPDAPELSLEELLPEGSRSVRVELAVRGRGAAHFAAVLRGFTDRVEERKENDFVITRADFLAAAPRHAGRAVPTGFGVLNDGRQRWSNTLTALPQGATGRMEVQYYRGVRRDDLPEERDYLLLEVPLPAGARVLRETVTGRFQSWEERDGVLQFQVGQHAGTGWVQFELVGAVPGDYRVLPVALRSAYRPDLLALSKPQDFAVLDRGAAPPDEYRPTPDELFHLGQARFQDGDAEGAWSALRALADDWGAELRSDRLREAATSLLYLAVDRDDPAAIVRFFEVLKEKDPELTVSFERVLAIGRAYRRLEEHERALLIFRAVVEETFGKDLKVAGALAGNRETAESFAVLHRLWSEYPDLPVVVEAELALSDQLLVAARTARQDASLKRAGLGRTQLSMRGIGVLRTFLALYGDDPLAADAGLNLVSAFLELEDYETTSALAGELAGRFTKPEFTDAFLYTRAVAEWSLSREDEAVRLLEGIAAAEYPDARGVARPSPNRDLALYILGQIFHARRDVARAAEYYARVEQQFRDARETLLDLREKRIGLPEVTTARPGEPVRLELEFRNVAKADVLVYAVDLMTLYLREKDLSRVTEVNLAGIAPELRRTVELGGGGDLLPRTHALDLALEDPGAYLVICRGDELHASGLVLVSELDLRVKEDPQAGSLRVQALARSDQRFLRDVDVRVVGSASGEFRIGKTDPRGVFVADGVSGAATVIAKMDGGHYAFFRGETLLAMAQGQRRESKDMPQQSLEPGGGGDGYLSNVYLLNDNNQAERQQRYKQTVEADRKGVQVKAVK